MTLLKMKAQGTNTSKYFSSLKLAQFPARRARARTAKQVFAKLKARLTKRGLAVFGTKQKFFNRLACPSTILIWSCQHMVIKKKIEIEEEDGALMEIDWSSDSDSDES